jgi:hypothetical protein
MKITSLDKNIEEVLTLGYYNIPRFQRSFSWEKDQVEEFWSDTIAENEVDYFIGSMVVFENDKTKKVYGIVDGQQRLTTITLILCALRNAFAREGFQDKAKGIHKLIERENIDFKPEFVLQPETSYPYFQEHIQKFGNPDILTKVSEEEKLLKNAYDLLSSNIQETIKSIKSDPTLNEETKSHQIEQKLTFIRSRILGLKVIHITLDNEDDAYVIFETMNTRGKDLSIADLLKSHLLKLIRPKNANVDIYKEKWNDIVTIIQGLDVPLDEFLYHHWLSKYERYVPAKRLFKSIRSFVKADNAKDYFDEIHKDAKIYASIIKPSSIEWAKNESEIRASLEAMSLFRVKQQLPMLLSVMRTYRASNLKQKHAQGMLDAIENFHFIFSAITSQRSSGGISGMYATHAIRLEDATSLDERIATINSLKNELYRRIPSFQEFEANFGELWYTDDSDKQKRLIQYILAKLDSYNQGGLPINYSQMTIEHIAPQKPKDGGKPLETVGRLGNLIYVSGELNNDLDNRTFTEKKAILQKSRIGIDELIKNADSWGDEQIIQRTKEIAAIAYEKVWKVRKV